MMHLASVALFAFSVSGASLPLESRGLTCNVGQGLGACTTGAAVHIIAARGTGGANQPKIGNLYEIALNISLAFGGNSNCEALDYPADGGKSFQEYYDSENAGVSAMKAAIGNYTTRCPTSRIVLIGYSQGAQVIGDTLGGGSFDGGPPAIDSIYTQKIVAAALISDLVHYKSGGTTYDYNVGTGVNDGRLVQGSFPVPASKRSQTLFNSYHQKLLSFCENNDYWCDRGSSIDVHNGAVANFGTRVVSMVVALVRG